MSGRIDKEAIVSSMKRVSGVILGAAIVALSLNYFIVPNRIVDGGITGIAIIIHYLTNFPAGWLVLGLNVPIFLLGLRKMGGRFLLLSVVGVLTLSFIMQITSGVKPITENNLLAGIFGGLLTGIGMGLIFRSQGSMGGTDIIALIINSRLSMSVGQVLLAIDAAIFLVAAVLFTPEKAMYAIIYMFIATRVIDYVQEGLSYSKAAIIISNQPEKIAQDIMRILERGVTYLHGSGAYSGDEKRVIYCVVSRAELARVKEIVRENDPEAFMALSEVPEVLGEGFKPVRGK